MGIIRDNYKAFTDWVKSREWPEGQMYHIQWMLRKKDGKCEKDSRAAKHWYVRNMAEFEKVKPSLYKYASEEGGRITIGINRKGITECNFALANHLMQESLNPHSYPLAAMEYPGIVDKCGAVSGGFYMLDVDPMPGETPDQMLDRVNHYCNIIDSVYPLDVPKKVSLVLQSKSGWHIIFTRCHAAAIMEQIAEDHHKYATFFKDSTTNLLIGE